MSDERSQADFSAELRIEGHHPDDYLGYEPAPWQADGEVGSNGGAVEGTEAEHQYGEITTRPDAEDVHFSEYEGRRYEYSPRDDLGYIESFDPDSREPVYHEGDGEEGTIEPAEISYDEETGDRVQEDWEQGAITSDDIRNRVAHHAYDPQYTNIEVFWGWVSNMGSEATNEHSTYWRRVSTLLQVTSDTLRTRGEALAAAWQGDAADAFLRQIGGTLYSLDEWDRIASDNAWGLARVATAIAHAQQELGRLYGSYWATVYLLDNWWKVPGNIPSNIEAVYDGMPIYNPQDPRWDPGTGASIDASNIIPPFNSLDEADAVDELSHDYSTSLTTGQEMLTGRVVEVASREDIKRVYHNRAADIIQELADTYNYENFNGFQEGRQFQGPIGLNSAPGGQPRDNSSFEAFMDQMRNTGIPGGGPSLPGNIAMPSVGPPNLGNLPGLDGGAGIDPAQLRGPVLPADGFLAGAPGMVPLSAGMFPTAALSPEQQTALAQQQALASRQAAFQAQAAGLGAQQQAQAVLQAARATQAAARGIGLGAIPDGRQPGGVPGLPGGVPNGLLGTAGVPGAVAEGLGGPEVAIPGLLNAPGLDGGATGLGGVGPDAPGTAAFPGTMAPGALAGPGATASGALAGPGAGGMMMPPPPPPMMPPMTGQQQNRPGAQGNQPGAQMPGAMPGMPGAPPPMFIPPGRTQQGTTPTAPKRVQPALAGASGRQANRAGGLRGAQSATPAAARPAPSQGNQAPAPETAPAEADRELWSVKKPKGVLQGSGPNRPTPHGKPIGAAG